MSTIFYFIFFSPTSKFSGLLKAAESDKLKALK